MSLAKTKWTKSLIIKEAKRLGMAPSESSLRTNKKLWDYVKGA